MAKSTGPILAIGAITIANQSLLNNKAFDWKIPIGTGFAAMIFSFLEKAPGGFGKAAGMLPWIGLFTVLLARTDPKIPSPVETLNKMWQKG